MHRGRHTVDVASRRSCGRLSWFGWRHQAKIVMHFAQVEGLPPRLIADHLNGLRHQATSIEWGNLMMPAGVDTPRNQKMLQLTDTAGGALYAAFEWDDYGNTERRYLETLRSQLWRPAGGALQTHGLKVCRGLTLATRGLRSSAGGRQREGSGPSAASPRCHCFQRLTGFPNPPSLSPTPRGMQRVRPIVAPQAGCLPERDRPFSVRR